ncbi:MAG: YhbY family RNA-binding protein [Planctomycetes bacterium]|nr:YhbY family RNA-binding protein [Planctomycetota bacterium]
MTLALSPAQLSFLRSRAHPLEAGVQLGKAGATVGFLKVLDQALKREELVKIRLGRLVSIDLEAVAVQVKSTLVSKVGRKAVFYRPFAEPRLELPVT